jgi:uncharacterized membrane protein
MNTIDSKQTANGQTVTGTYDTHHQAEIAVKDLVSKGFKMSDLTVLGMDYHSEEHPVGFINTGDRMIATGKYGAFWGGLWGLLFGSAFLFIPGVGPIVVAGWLASSLIGAAEGIIVGGALGALGAALLSSGIPKDSVVEYQSSVQAGKFLVIARGDEKALETARVAFDLH